MDSTVHQGTVHQGTVQEKEVMLIWNDKQRKLEVPPYPGGDDEIVTVSSLSIYTLHQYYCKTLRTLKLLSGNRL